MTGLVRKATLMGVCGLLVAGSAMAGVPDPANSSIGLGINFGGSLGGAVDPLATKTVTIRDAFNNLVANSTVVVTFTNCTNSDMRLCGAQPHHPGALFNCAAKTVTAVTDANGVATFRVAGGAANPGNNGAGVGVGCATVQADGVPMGSWTVGAPDENNGGGVSVADLGLFGADRFGVNYRGRSDFNWSGPPISVADLGIFGQFRFSAVSGNAGSSCGVACP
jgi:hypothetical protein